ncbi:MAG TPA: AmmeMemoRadiSam system protein B [Bacteroidales bacterium]|nr:AmmeMemoRadiSam system protein B [Bacteroidales bacterium]
MRILLISFVSLLLFAMEASSQNNITDRQPVAAGRFYSADKTTLKNDLEGFFRECKKSDGDNVVRAIIVPHAGYVFSGKTAASAYYSIPSDATFNNIFIIGSSHVMSFDGASVYNIGDYITPLGKVAVNRELADKLIKDNNVFNYPVTAHIQEHSIEVQIPFIQYHFKHQAKIVPIIIGTQKEGTLRKIAEALKPYFTKENLFIISSDFSHYPGYRDAVEADKRTALGIMTGKPSLFLNSLEQNEQKHFKGLVTSMCGWTSGLTLLYLAEDAGNLGYNLIDYTNSGDSSYGSKDEVVGYNAISLTEKVESREFSFTESEKEQLFTLAKNSVKAKLDNTVYKPVISALSPKLSEPMGVFVTLKIDGALRGCIGRFISSEPLYEVVQASAVSSAFEDPRFPPLTRKEFEKTDFEITVLGPLKRIKSIDELILGKHGIYMRKDMRSGTMLPQVATENGWTKEQFLGYTARDKAGIGWEGWKDAELYIYDGVVLEEKKN